MHDPKAQVCSAIAALNVADDIRVESRSSLYSSPPMGPADQPNYVNAVVEIRTCLESLELLDRLQQIERDHGRVRGDVRWGPRTLDLDILLFDAISVDGDRLRIPHPGLAERAFVIVPLAEIAPELVLPNGVLAAELAKLVPEGALTLLADK